MTANLFQTQAFRLEGLMSAALPPASENPFDAPKSLSTLRPLKTAAGYTSSQCFLRFLLAGTAAGIVGGASLSHVVTNATTIIAQFGAIGLPFAGALMLSINRFIGAMPRAKSLFIVIGAAVGFICCGIVYQLVFNHEFRNAWMGPQPLSWRQMLAPGFWGAATGSALIAIVLWVAGGRFTWKTTATTWAIMTAIGFATIIVSDEIALRRRIFSAPLTYGVAGGIYIAVVLAMLGWHLAEANGTPDAASEQR